MGPGAVTAEAFRGDAAISESVAPRRAPVASGPLRPAVLLLDLQPPPRSPGPRTRWPRPWRRGPRTRARSPAPTPPGHHARPAHGEHQVMPRRPPAGRVDHEAVER